MGHRHTPEGNSGARRFFGTEHRSAASFAHSVETAAPRVLPAVAAQSIGVRLALFALRFYKTYLSSMMAGSCRFEPTCSRYAYEAVERFGVARGGWLTLKRLLRCQPLSRRFGYDPVPDSLESYPHGPAHHEAHS